MGKIVRMSEQLANMIAAGEVIERPASVVKELVENAIDANSTKVEIHLHDAGVRQIRVMDNGDGMSFEDVPLAFERHATSKVKTQYDIFRIQTLGFRGEALPSIASVSDVTVKSSDGEVSGVHYHIKGGEVIAHEPALMRKGTDMEVNHLFFNTPARLKHIKSLNTELSHITDYVNKVALAHPEISFKLFNNQRLLFQTNGQNNVQSVIASIYGFEVAKKMLPLQAKTDEFTISGYVSDPIINRASRHYVTLIVNGRAIRHYPLTRTILEAYHTLLPKDKYPIVVLNLNLDPVLVDVNVHPAKLEVRFSQEEALKSFVLTEVKKVLKTIQYIPETTLTTPVAKPTTQPLQQTLQQANEPSLTPEMIRSVDAAITNDEVMVESSVVNTKNQDEIQESTVPMTHDEPRPIISEGLTVSAPTPAQETLTLYYIGQLHGTYLLAQNEEGLYLIDQHAAMERVQYEKLYEQLGNASTQSIELLVPFLLTYTQKEVLLLRHQLHVLEQFGFFVEVFGQAEIIVRRVPVFAQQDGLAIVETIIQQLLNQKQIELSKLREAIAITMSCKGSIKANQYINEHEIKQLLADLCRCEQPYTCPHGRPITVKLTKYEIEKLFKRVM